MAKQSKGSALERAFCVFLSEWWRGRDDIFWRTAGSGGRATSRSRRLGKATTNAHGDIGALHKSGRRLLKVITFELKCGYNHCSLGLLMDKPDTAALQELEKWIEQAVESQKAAKSVTWMIVHKRDRRDHLAIFPVKFLRLLRKAGAFDKRPNPIAMYHGKIGEHRRHFVVMKLKDFFLNVTPQHIKDISDDQ